MKVLFVYNPVAGQLQIKSYLWNILNFFSREKVELTVYATQKSKEAYQLVKKYGAKYDRIICSGGDGTLHEVINGMMETESDNILGYIPAGSVNDFAASLNLPKNKNKAAEIALKGKTKNLDVGKFNDLFFIYVAAFGVFTEVAYETTQEMKNILGRLAYFLQGVKSIASMKTYQVKMIEKGIETEDEYIFGMITNTLSVGSLYKLSDQNVELDDGLFEVTLIKVPHDLMELNLLTNFLLYGKEGNNLVKTFKTDNIEFIFDEPASWTLDGEYGGKPKEVKIEVIEKTINFACE